eukprot:SAG31_NODE_184_length_20985_cov_28.867567_18_plen_62_part_00
MFRDVYAGRPRADRAAGCDAQERDTSTAERFVVPKGCDVCGERVEVLSHRAARGRRLCARS